MGLCVLEFLLVFDEEGLQLLDDGGLGLSLLDDFVGF